MAEKWDLYDIDRVKTGEIMERGEQIPPKRYHLAVHVCIFGSDGRMLIQQRQPFKEGWSNMWDVTVAALRFRKTRAKPPPNARSWKR